MSENYHTNSKKLILQVLKSYHQNFSAKELHQILCTQHQQISLATIYRVLDEFASKNILRKTIDSSNNTAYYRYLFPCNQPNHFYLECQQCKQIFHIDCDFISDFTSHIHCAHHFNISAKQLFIPGFCEKCSQELKNHHA